MTTFVPVPVSDRDQDSPVTQPLMTALYLNPFAIAEGSTDESNTPIVATGWHPYDKTVVGGTATGTFYDNATDGNVSSVETPDFEDGYEYAILFEGLSAVVGTDLRLRAFRVATGSFGSYLDLGAMTTNPSSPMYGLITVSTPRLVLSAHGVEWLSPLCADGSTSPANAFDKSAFAHSGVTRIGKIEVSLLGSNFDAGTMKLLRRREYVSG